jgi:hypothetical protein
MSPKNNDEDAEEAKDAEDLVVSFPAGNDNTSVA